MRGIKRYISSVLAFVLLFGVLPGTAAVYAADSGVTVSMDMFKDIDVALAVGDSDVDILSFEEDLNAKLQALDVPSDRVKISTVKTTAVSAGNTSNGWWTYDHVTDHWHYVTTSGGSWVDGASDVVPLPEDAAGTPPYQHIWTYNSGKKIVFYGYESPGYRDFMYMPNTSPTKKTFTFTMDDTNINNHSMKGGGFLFNTNISGTPVLPDGEVADLSTVDGRGTNAGSTVKSEVIDSQTISGYYLLLVKDYSGQSYPELYKITNMPMSQFHNASFSASGGSIERVAFSNDKLSGVHNIKIEVAGASFKMWDTVDGVTNTLEYNELEDTGSYGFGPIAEYIGHGCDALSWFTFENLQMQTTRTKLFMEVLREPEWRNSAEKFVVNLNDETQTDFEDNAALGEILSRMNNEEMHYIGWGLDDGEDVADLTQDQAQQFIERNENRGTFVNRNGTDYDAQLEAIAQYIADRYNAAKKSNVDEFPVGTSHEYHVTPVSEEKDTNGKWTVNYAPLPTVTEATYFPYAGMPFDDLDFDFDVPGTYTILYDGETVKTVEVYTEPVSYFEVELTEVDDHFSIDLTNHSYDPYDPGQPVTTGDQWRYKEVNSDAWTEGKPDTLDEGKDYVIELRVEDGHGGWSKPYTKHVSTKNTAPKPIADFTISPQDKLDLSKQTTVDLKNLSYDPTTNALSEVTVKVVKDGEVVIGPTVMTTPDWTIDFTLPSDPSKTMPAGKYDIVVIAKNSDTVPVESEEFVRSILLVDDQTKPTAKASKDSGGVMAPFDVSVTFSDEGDSGFAYQKYAVTNSADAPNGSAWSGWSGKTVRNFQLTELGIWYIHVQAADRAGNEIEMHFGPYLVHNAENAKTVPVNQTVNFSVTEFVYSISDPTEFNTMESIVITELPEHGKLQFQGNDLSVTDSVYRGDLGQITFVPDENWNGVTQFKWKSFDGTVLLGTEHTVTLIVNTAPAPVNSTKNGSQGQNVKFTLNDFPIDDVDQNTVTEIKIISLPEHGTLKLNGTDVTVNQVISAESIPLLTFEPDKGWTGSTTFLWRGSDVIGYTDSDSVMTITVRQPDDEPVVEEISVDVDAGQGEAVSKAKITRTTAPDGTAKDEVVFTAENAAEAVGNLSTQGSDTARIVIPDANDKVSETKVSVPKDALAVLVEGKKNLEIFTANGRIVIPYSSFAGLSEDLYFRIVPIKKESEKQEVIRRVKQEEMVREIAQNDSVRILGRPMTIETNMESQPVRISFPLYDRLPEDKEERDALLSNLVIFVEHDDGTKELVKGTLTNYATADDMGVEFDIAKFSTFTMVYMEGWEAYLAALEGQGAEGSHTAYVSGYPDGTFGPNKSLTRAEVAALLSRNLKDQSPVGEPLAFEDLGSTHWAYDEIQLVTESGLMKGYPDGKFYPNRIITRAEMATIAFAWKGLENTHPSVFADTAKHWAEGMIGALNQAGIMEGYEDGTFRPDQGLTRAEGVHLFNILLERGPLNGVEKASWPDVPSTHWAFADIEEASKDHAYSRKDGKEFLVQAEKKAQ